MEWGNAYVARFGRTVIRGDDFVGVCDALIEKGFEVHLAKEVKRGVLEIPHPTRKPAQLRSWHADHAAQEEEKAAQEEPKATLAELRAIVGIQVRQCGSVHSEGVVCMVPVYFEAPPCGCADRVYAHTGYHEAVTEDGVTHRWTEVLEIVDADYNAYGPEADGEEAVSA